MEDIHEFKMIRTFQTPFVNEDDIYDLVTDREKIKKLNEEGISLQILSIDNAEFGQVVLKLTVKFDSEIKNLKQHVEDRVCKIFGVSVVQK